MLQVAAAQLPPETDIVKLKTRLYDQYRVEDPLVNWNGMKFVRISVQGYNTQRDADQFLEAMSNLL
ncbi:MAG: hypothetical protein HYR70_06535 [Chloroflexi bacterium]|nr:hypothetical protein [Chloroflexota bacterium]MBI1855448.1 hypothetical protein [Chloroflexota bacterium]MBI3341114.1 hypothetical protein [Chloroflexota bacterium]